MRTAPSWWGHGQASPWPVFLAPLSWAVARATHRRVARPGWRAPVPVICCGNAGVGGAGKTTLVLDLAARLLRRGLAVHLLTRGYRGRLRGPLRVDPAAHTTLEVGDEALLLAACAPTWLGADRAATARAALAAGAEVLLMDDGLQNPTLHQTTRLLVVDGATGFGNGRVLPAGPLREPAPAAAARSTGAVLLGPDRTGVLADLPPCLPVLCAQLRPGPEAVALLHRRVLAFAGIGRPEKFFDMLAAAGVIVVRRVRLPDHHRFSARELARLAADASGLDAVPVTTPKDMARIPQDARAPFTAVGVSLAWDDEGALAATLDAALQVAGPIARSCLRVTNP